MNGDLPIPRLVAWEVTRRCNLRCRHCRASAEDCAYANELTLDEAKALVDDIASFAHPILILTGGEPLLCPWLWDVIAHAREKGCRPVLGTNATLIDGTVARRLAAAGIPRISVSLDFPTADAHDAFRGVAGAFEASRRGIAAAIAAGVEVQVNTTVTRLNADCIDAMHDLAVRLGAKAWHPFLLVPTGRGKDLAEVELTPSEYERVLTRIAKLSSVSPLEIKPTDAPQYRRVVRQCGGAAGCGPGRGCLAGTGFAFVSHVGDVQPCGYFDRTLGNVRETRFSEIWRTSPVFDDLRHPERLKGKCGVCEFRSVCGGCRARALARTGDYLASEPFCAHVPDRTLLAELQTDFPLAHHPYAVLGARLGLSEDEVYARIVDFERRGLVRRIGPSWNPSRFGRVSTLVAFAVDSDRLDVVAARVSALGGVTHNYAREGRYNLWFTLIASDRGEIAATLAELVRETGVRDFLELPSTKTYKLKAVFK